MFDPTGCDAVFFQPHSDDVALSCGGTVALCARAGRRAHLLSVFSGQVLDPMVGSLAREKHARWNLHDVDALFETRRAEDSEAVEALGCSVRWLEMPDAIYRGKRYPSNDELFGPLHEEEHDIARHLLVEVENLPEWQANFTAFVPLATGDHVDHQIVFELGALLARAGYPVFAYEDTPYAIHSPQGVHRRIAALAGRLGDPFAVDIHETLEARLEAIAAYRSQLPVIFRFTQDWRGAVSEFSRSRGNGSPAERFWPIIR